MIDQRLSDSPTSRYQSPGEETSYLNKEIRPRRHSNPSRAENKKETGALLFRRIRYGLAATRVL